MNSTTEWHISWVLSITKWYISWGVVLLNSTFANG